MSKKRSFITAALLLAVTVGGPAAHAQQKAFSIPVSDKIVRLEVQVPSDGRWIKAKVLEGDQFRLEDRDLNLKLAFIPVRQAEGVRVRVFRIQTRQDGNETLHFIQNIDNAIGDTGFTKDLGVGQKRATVFGVKVIEILDAPVFDEPSGTYQRKSCLPAKATPAAVGTLAKIGGGGGRCCVTCGSTTSCGCAVDDSCGSCCAGMCCAV